jgi:hypothetical protein
MSSFMPRWQECQEDFPGVLVQKMILHRRVAQAPVCTLPLLDIPCPCVVPIIRLERNHSLRSGKMPFSPTIPSILAPVSPLASVWTTMTPP